MWVALGTGGGRVCWLEVRREGDRVERYFRMSTSRIVLH